MKKTTNCILTLALGFTFQVSLVQAQGNIDNSSEVTEPVQVTTQLLANEEDC